MMKFESRITNQNQTRNNNNQESIPSKTIHHPVNQKPLNTTTKPSNQPFLPIQSSLPIIKSSSTATTSSLPIELKPIPTNLPSLPSTSTSSSTSSSSSSTSSSIDLEIDQSNSNEVLILLLIEHLTSISNQSQSIDSLQIALNSVHQFDPNSISPILLNRLRSILCPSLDSSPLNKLSSASLFNQLCTPQFTSTPQQQTFSKRSQPSSPLSHLFRRQTVQGDGTGPYADGYPACTAVSNAVLSCFPESNTTIVQHTWSKFIWNNNYPTFIGSRFVDIYLFNAQSETIVANWTSIANDRGMIGIYASDNWFPNQTTWTYGQNRTFPYFFVLTGSGMPLTGGEQHQSTFTVLQTAPPAALASSLSTNSLSTMSSYNQSYHPANSTSTTQPGSNSTSSLQHASSDQPFPKWEIALIVVLGVLALVTFLIATYLTVSNARRRRQIRNWHNVAIGGSGGSIGSRSPMIQNPEVAALIGQTRQKRHEIGGPGGGATSGRDINSPSSSRPGSPMSATATGGAASFAYPTIVGGAGGFGTGSQTTGVNETSTNPDGPISSVDASIMADAFRKALRKPEFAPPTQDDSNSETSPETESKAFVPAPPRTRVSMHAQVVSMDDLGGGENEEEVDDEDAKEIMDRELASEGRSMTSVDVRKRPEVHS